MGSSCPNCGTEVEAAWQFCRSCGEPIDDVDDRVGTASDTTDAAEPTSEVAEAGPEAEAEADLAYRRKVTTGVLIAVVVLVLLIAGGMYALDAMSG